MKKKKNTATTPAPENPSIGATYRKTREGKLNLERHWFYLLTWTLSPIVYLLHYRGMFYEQERLKVGVVILIVGVIFAWIGNSQLKKLFNAQNDGNRRLFTHGMFRFCRHPFYFAQSVIMVGMVVLFPCMLSVIFLVFYFWTTHRTMIEEEKNMMAEFAESYTEYQRTTPMLFPWKIWRWFG